MNGTENAVATAQEPRSGGEQGDGQGDLPLCSCGCGRPVAVAADGKPLKYADHKICRMVLFKLQHPRLDLGGLSPVTAKRAARMAAEAIKAAKQGQGRATVDADAEVEHGRDPRASCRVRLSPETWEKLGQIVSSWSTLPENQDRKRKLSHSEVVSILIYIEHRRLQEAP